MAPIHEAAARGDLAAVIRCVEEEGVSPMLPEPLQENGQPLHCAAARGHLHVLTYLLDSCGVDVQATCGTGETTATALLLAAVQNRTPTVRLLLQHGANPNALSGLGAPALIVATGKGHNEVVKALLEDERCDLEVTFSDEQVTCLHLALRLSRWEIAKMVLLKGASLLTTTASGVDLAAMCQDNPFPGQINALLMRLASPPLVTRWLYRGRCINDTVDTLSAALAKFEAGGGEATTTTTAAATTTTTTAASSTHAQAQASHIATRTRGHKRRLLSAQAPAYLKKRVEKGGGGGGDNMSSSLLSVLPRIELAPSTHTHTHTHTPPHDETTEVQRAVVMYVLGRDEEGGKGGGMLKEHVVELMDMLLPVWDPERKRG